MTPTPSVSSEIDLDELEVLHKAATGGEWEVDQHGSAVLIAGSGGYVGYPSRTGAVASLDDGEYIENVNSSNDAALIAALRNAATALIEGCRERDRLGAALNKIADLGCCAGGKVPAYKLLQDAIHIAVGAVTARAALGEQPK